jgi:NAD(P)-dependent dehydrogenase (short-subunit alcohol dehydrogenase family)
MSNLLSNKVSLITGAASGIGKAIAWKFLQHSAPLILVDRNQEKLSEIAAELKDQPHAHVLTFSADVSDEEAVHEVVRESIKHFGVVDVLVNNAGILDDFSGVSEMGLEQYRHVMNVNLNGAVYFSHFLLPEMLREGKGSIINTASVGGLNGARAGAAYTMSKHAMIGLTKHTAFSYAKQGIRCNALCPGGINTDISKGISVNEIGYQKSALGFPLIPRMGEANEIAELALFLASDLSSLLNGAVMVADAGWSSY